MTASEYVFGVAMTVLIVWIVAEVEHRSDGVTVFKAAP